MCGQGSASWNGRSEFADMTFSVAGDAADLAVATHAGARVSGRVAFAGAPPASLPEIRIALRRADDGAGPSDPYPIFCMDADPLARWTPLDEANENIE